MEKYAILMLMNSYPEGYDYEYYVDYEIRNNYTWINGAWEIEKAKVFNTIEEAKNTLSFIKKNNTFDYLLHIIVIDEIN